LALKRIQRPLAVLKGLVWKQSKINNRHREYLHKFIDLVVSRKVFLRGAIGKSNVPYIKTRKRRDLVLFCIHILMVSRSQSKQILSSFVLNCDGKKAQISGLKEATRLLMRSARIASSYEPMVLLRKEGTKKLRL
jgi:hypothetical protein